MEEQEYNQCCYAASLTHFNTLSRSSRFAYFHLDSNMTWLWDTEGYQKPHLCLTELYLLFAHRPTICKPSTSNLWIRLKLPKITLTHKRIQHALLSKHLIHNLFSLQYSSILTPPSYPRQSLSVLFLASFFYQPSHSIACNEGHSEAEQNRKTGMSHWERAGVACPKNLKYPEKMSKFTTLHISHFHPPHNLSSLILCSLWTGLFSAAGQPLCTCWRPLWIVSAWPVHCPACGELAPSVAFHLSPSSTILCGRTWGLPPGNSRGRRSAQQNKKLQKEKNSTSL